jgi:hypothetical protein
MIKTAIIIIGTLGLIACATPQERRARFVSAHPELRQEYLAAVRNGTIIEGMNTKTVRASLGRPQRTYTKIFGSTPAAYWEYRFAGGENYTLIFRNNILIKIQRSML